MQGFILGFYVHEGDRHDGQMVWEWLLQEANKRDVGGGSVFRAMAGFGRQHVLHERKFFELAGSQVLKVEFVVTDDEARDLIALVHREQLRLFYVQSPAQLGVIDPTQPLK
jgi:PII-like signaling protein